MFLGGSLFFAGVLIWIPYSDPVTWVPVEGSEARVLLYVFYILAIALSATSWLALSYILSISQKWSKKSSFRLYLVFASGWVATEWLRAFLASLLVWSPDSLVGAHWGFGALGFFSSATPLVIIARTVGVYGLSLLVVAINACLLEILNRNFKPALLAAAGIVILVLVSTVPYRNDGAVIKAGAIQLNSPLLEEYMPGLLAKAKSQEADLKLDLLVTPEYLNLFEMQETRERDQALYLITKPDTVIISSSAYQSDESSLTTNRQFFYDRSGQELAWNDKSLLSPGSEYLPIGTEWALSLLGHQSLVNEFYVQGAVKKGSSFETIFIQDQLKIGALICSGVVSPFQYQRLAQQNPNVLTNSASLAAFGKNSKYFNQAMQMARFHAVANNKPFVQSAAQGNSFILDRNGSWLARSENADRPVELITSDLKLSNQTSFYTLAGEIFAYLSIGAVLLIGLLGLRKQKLVKPKSKSKSESKRNTKKS